MDSASARIALCAAHETTRARIVAALALGGHEPVAASGSPGQLIEASRPAVPALVVLAEGEIERALSATVQAALAEQLCVPASMREALARPVFSQAPGARAVWLERHDGLADVLAAAAACSDADVLVVVRPSLKPSSSDAIACLVEHLEHYPYAAVAAPTRRHDPDAAGRSVRSAPGQRSFSPVKWVRAGVVAIRRADLDAAGGSAGRLPGWLRGDGPARHRAREPADVAARSRSLGPNARRRGQRPRGLLSHKRPRRPPAAAAAGDPRRASAGLQVSQRESGLGLELP